MIANLLKQIILRDLNIEVTTPVIHNRGNTTDGVIRWSCQEITGQKRTFFSEDPMTICVKNGVDQPRLSNHQWFIDTK